MFLTPHTSAAIWIATKVADPFLAFLFGIISHFILDIIPHGDEELFNYKKDSKFVYFLKVALTDIAIATVIVVFYVMKKPGIDRAIVSWAVLGAWFPDLLAISAETFKFKFLTWYLRIHSRIHSLINWRYSIVYGVPFQIIVTIILLKASF